jgi:polyribonucleotide nucleotidyltransferase
VKCIGVDDKGRVKLSRKAAMKDRDEAAKQV